MKAKELCQKTKKELSNLLNEKSHKLGQFKFDLASKKLKNIRQVRELRRDVARIKTILNQ